MGLYVNRLKEIFKEFVYSDTWKDAHREEIQKLGQEISSAHGFSGMQTVYRAFADTLFDGLGDIQASVLSSMWNGIGGWMF